MNTLDPRRLMETSVLEIRGDGKAGGGLVLAFQSLANLLIKAGDVHVQEWPFFSSARRGANIRSFLRVGVKPISKACEITRPQMVLLMNEGTAHAVDFTQGVPFGGTYVINTRRGPEACARHFGLAGRVLTIPGDDIGHEHLKAPIGNVSAYVAMSEAIGGFAREDVVEVFLSMLRKRHVPDMVVERNRKALEASFAALSSGNFAMQSHEGPARPEFPGYGDLPVGAQTQLRLSAANRTAFFAPSGFRLKFEDPTGACNGCAHCITNCPEGIIRFDPDPEQGLRVTGADVSTFCKLCQECIAVCPEKLFTSAPYEERWQEEEVEAS